MSGGVLLCPERPLMDPLLVNAEVTATAVVYTQEENDKEEDNDNG